MSPAWTGKLKLWYSQQYHFDTSKHELRCCLLWCDCILQDGCVTRQCDYVGGKHKGLQCLLTKKLMIKIRFKGEGGILRKCKHPSKVALSLPLMSFPRTKTDDDHLVHRRPVDIARMVNQQPRNLIVNEANSRSVRISLSTREAQYLVKVGSMEKRPSAMKPCTLSSGVVELLARSSRHVKSSASFGSE